MNFLSEVTEILAYLLVVAIIIIMCMFAERGERENEIRRGSKSSSQTERNES